MIQVMTRLEQVDRLVGLAFQRLDPSRPDAQQPESYDLALCAADLAAARAVLEHAASTRAQGALLRPLALQFVAEAIDATLARLAGRAQDHGLRAAEIHALHAEDIPELAQALRSRTMEALGEALVADEHALPGLGLDAEHELMRETFEHFGRETVAPLAQRIHAEDLDVPEAIIGPAAQLGLFGVSIPQRFGGLQPDDHPDTLAMVAVTEALSAASLGAAGSLVTRPEIMARALLSGGTPAQQARWLPRLASGESLCAISITEPDFGSDVASIRLRASRSGDGWLLSGAKTWCTFAGRADVLLVLARTSPDTKLGHRGLSLFIVEKPAGAGHAFEHASPGGGQLTGRAIPTIGYRGMHSYELHFDDFFVPREALVGGEEGLGKGFYFTMTGFAGGRIQTAARANGVMLAALEDAIRYGRQRRVFGQPVADYGLTRARLARMAAWITASRQFTCSVARAMDGGAGEMQASLVKLFACRAAEWVTRDAMQVHGGMGYAEESSASRYFVDARVLSIFEGAEETLALKVIARELSNRARRAAG